MSTLCPIRPKIETIGFSIENRAISLYLYSPDGTPVKHLNTLFIGVFHGDEGISGQLLLRWVNHMENVGLKSDFPAFGIIPILNPDGHLKNQRMNARNVDLNRNYPTQDWVEENKDTIYYSGTSAASEPETQLLIRTLEQYQPEKIITVHSPYKVLNFDGPARGLADAMSKVSGYPVTEDIGYATPGSFGTYLGKERNLPVITLELPDQENLDEQVWQDNHPALEAALFY